VKTATTLLAVSGIFVLLATIVPANAGTQSGSFTVGSTTAKNCTNPIAANITLPNYDGTAQVTGNTFIYFKCTRTTPVTTTLKPGGVVSSSGTLNTSPVNSTPINYTISPFPFTTGPGHIYTGTGSGLSSTANFVTAIPNIVVPAGQNPIPGTYSDTITVEVSF
jgi:spore coat protein U-like protein